MHIQSPNNNNNNNIPSQTIQQDPLKLVMEDCGYLAAYYGGSAALKLSKPFLLFFKPLYYVTTAPYHILSRILKAVPKALMPPAFFPSVLPVRVAYRTDGTVAKPHTSSLPRSVAETSLSPGPLRIAQDDAFRCLGYCFETVFGEPLFETETKPARSKKPFVSEFSSVRFLRRKASRDQSCRAVVRYRSNIYLQLVRFLDFLTEPNACRFLRACDLPGDTIPRSIPMDRRVFLRFPGPVPYSQPQKPPRNQVVPYRGHASPLDSIAEERSTTVEKKAPSKNVESSNQPALQPKPEWEEVSLGLDDDDTARNPSDKNVAPDSATRPDECPNGSPSCDAAIPGSESEPAEHDVPVLDGPATTDSTHPPHSPAVSNSSLLFGIASSLSTIAEHTKNDAVILMKRKEVRVTRVSVMEVTQGNLQSIGEEKAVEGETAAADDQEAGSDSHGSTSVGGESERSITRDSGIQNCETGRESHKGECRHGKRHGVACRVKHAFSKMKSKFSNAEEARGG